MGRGYAGTFRLLAAYGRCVQPSRGAISRYCERGARGRGLIHDRKPRHTLGHFYYSLPMGMAVTWFAVDAQSGAGFAIRALGKDGVFPAMRIGGCFSEVDFITIL